MPKKSSGTRGSVQRNRTKAQKSFELVRPVTEDQSSRSDTPEETAPVPETASVSATSKSARVRTSTTTTPAKPATPDVESTSEQESTEVRTPPKGSAAARLAARRQATLRAQQRSAASLITAEHFAYVRRDLITIAILASVMLAIIVILFFAFGTTI
jgi:hypothetical protein